jgi:hypothetical protein
MGNLNYPAPLRDLLVQLATTGIFRAKWTELIHDEWTRNLLIKRPDLNASESGLGNFRCDAPRSSQRELILG